MKLIYYEIKKVLSKSFFVSLLVFCFIINLCVFYFVHNDYQDNMYKSVKNEYRQTLEAYSEMTNEEVKKAVEVNDKIYSIYFDMQNLYQSFDEGMFEFWLDNLEQERRDYSEEYAAAEKIFESSEEYSNRIYINSIIKTQLDYLDMYPDFVGEMKERADEQTAFSVFSDKDSFSYKNIIKTVEDYKGLEEIELTLGNDYSFTSAMTYNITDYFLIAVFFLMCIYLFRHESEYGLYSLVRSSENGRFKTISAKLFAAVILTTVITLFMVFGIFIESIIMFGSWDLSRTVQSVREFRNCVLPVRCDEFCLLFIFGKILSMLVISVFFSFVFICISNTIVTYITSVGFLIVEYILYKAVPSNVFFNHLKYINIFYLLDSNICWGKYLNLNLFTEPVWSCGITLIFAVILFLICALSSAVVFTLKSMEHSPDLISAKIESFKQKHSKIRGSAAVLNGEFYKYLISSKMAVILLAIIIFAVASSLGTVQYSIDDKDVISYRNYIMSLEGKTPEEVQEFINDETAYYESLRERVKEISENDSISKNTKEIALYSINGILESNGAGFDMVYRQYVRLCELEKSGIDARFVDEVVYSDFLNNAYREWKTLLICFVFMIITIPFVFTFEYRNDMIDLLQATRHGRCKLFLAKLFVVALSSAVTFSASYVPYMVRFVKSFGTRSMSTLIVCISDFENSKAVISIKGAFALETLVYFLISVMAVTVIVTVSIYVKNHMLSAVFSAVVLIIPCFILYSFEDVRVGALLYNNSVMKISVLSLTVVMISAVFLFISLLKFTGLTLKRR